MARWHLQDYGLPVGAPTAPGSSESNKASDEKEPRLTVESTDNHIYFYAVVDSDRCLALIKKVRELDRTLRSEHLSRDLPTDYPPAPIWLHIQSGGGSLFAGLSVADQLASIPTPIYSLIEGYCASAATLISMSCHKRLIMPSAFVLIHQLSAFTWGKYEEIKDEVHLLDMAMARLRTFYTEHSSLDEAEVTELLKRDTWFSADEALRHGLVDEMYGGGGR